MKNLILILTAILTLSACAEKEHFYYGQLTVEGSDFVTTAAPKYHKCCVETSAVMYQGKPVYLPSRKPGDLSVDFLDGSPIFTVETYVHYAYIFESPTPGVYYNVTKIGFDGDVYIKRSTDLINWQILNGGQPVLKHGPGDYSHIWNPGAAIDDNGVWHLFVECGQQGSQADVGLCYSTATMVNDMIDFEPNKSPGIVLPGGGNPWIGNVPGKGLVAVYGKANSPVNQFGMEWYVAAAVLPNGSTQWTESPTFRIGETGIHVCDPHLVETTEGVSMLVSYNQNSAYELKTTKTMSELFDIVAQ